MGAQAAAQKNKKITATNKQTGVKNKKIIVNCTRPTEDRIFDPAAFTTFLQQRIKVSGRTGNLGDHIVVAPSAKEAAIIEITCKDNNVALSGRYIKYLTKKFLKKQQLRDWLRVVSEGGCRYNLKFFNVVPDVDAEDAEDDDE